MKAVLFDVERTLMDCAQQTIAAWAANAVLLRLRHLANSAATALSGRHAELFGPVSHFIIFARADAATVLGAFLLAIVAHLLPRLVGESS
jgi:hypothetical protein